VASALIGERRLDGGWRERIRIPLPAVCSVEGAGTRLRRASLHGVLSAEATAVTLDRRSGPGVEVGPDPAQIGAPRPFEPPTRVLSPPDGDDPRVRLLALTGALVAHDPPTVIGPVDAGLAADAVIGYLVRHGYLDSPTGGIGPEDGR
jgi:electron transfer flavoprotein beta subunit